MRYDLKVGSVSWIDGNPSPIWAAAKAKLMEPEWVLKTYMGLRATRNPAPPQALGDFKAYQGGRNFRALTYLHVSFDAGGGAGVSNFHVHDAVHDAGWTPPFSITEYPSTLLPAVFDKDLRDTQWYQGEASALSVVCTEGRHKNTAITAVPKDEVVLANALIKFRAGDHTDKVGLRIGSPFHVPWVWNEWVLTYAAGRLKLYRRASKFPSHAWYVHGKQVAKVSEIGDSSFPLKPLVPHYVPRPFGGGGPMNMTTNVISVEGLQLYPILSAGASASGPQVPNGQVERERAGPVDTHPNTASGWEVAALDVSL